MQPRLSLVTLGVSDMARSRAFYEALGFKASRASQESVTFFDAGSVVLALFGRHALAEDAHVGDSAPGFSGVALAHNARSEGEVDQVLREAVAAGANLLKPGQKVFWGGYSGYFADPDGHLWEVAYNPFFPLDAAGRIRLPGSIDHDNYGDAHIAAILRETRIFAVVGASPNARRPSYGVMEFLLARGYEVIPVNTGHAGGEILGQMVYSTLADVPGPVDVVDFFRNPNAVHDAVREAIALKDKLAIKTVWMQLGVRNDQAAAEAEAAGLSVVMNRCPKMEIERLGRRSE